MYPSRGILILAACLTACAGFKNTWDASKEFDQANFLPLEEADLDLISGKRDAGKCYIVYPPFFKHYSLTFMHPHKIHYIPLTTY